MVKGNTVPKYGLTIYYMDDDLNIDERFFFETGSLNEVRAKAVHMFNFPPKKLKKGEYVYRVGIETAEKRLGFVEWNTHNAVWIPEGKFQYAEINADGTLGRTHSLTSKKK